MDSGREERRNRFEVLTMPLMRPLFAFAVRLTRHKEEAGDLVQETFLRAYRTFDNFQPGTNARAWLFTILYSIHVNEAKRRSRRLVTVSIEGVEDSGPIEIADWSGVTQILTNPAIDWEGSEVERELAALPEPFRQAVVLVDLGELTYEEAAHVAGCPVGTIRSRLARARRQLATRLRDLARRRGLVKE